MLVKQESARSSRHADTTPHPILICLLGNFVLLKAGRPVGLRYGGKTQGLLYHLGLQHRHAVPRDMLLNVLWPASDIALASQSLHSLVYSLHELVGDAIGGAAPVLHEEGHYRLNVEAGIGVDVACFDALTETGDQYIRAGSMTAAVNAYTSAVDLYRGELDDLHDGMDVQIVVERERLRARCLTLLAQLADYHYGQRDYEACAKHAWRLLANDPCREDAHRVVMRCNVRRGERSEALRQYRVCKDILRTEFDVAPEAATTTLFDQIRLDPASI